MFKKLLAVVAAVICSGAIALGANIALLTGPQPAADLASIINGLIQSINAGVTGNIFSNMSPIATSATQIELTLGTFPMASNTISAAGQGVRVKCWGNTGTSTATKTIKLYFGSTSITSGALAMNNTAWEMNMLVLRNTATAQILNGTFFQNTSQTTISPVIVFTASPTETLTGAVTIKCTGQNGASTFGDINFNGMLIEQIK